MHCTLGSEYALIARGLFVLNIRCGKHGYVAVLIADTRRQAQSCRALLIAYLVRQPGNEKNVTLLRIKPTRSASMSSPLELTEMTVWT